MTHLLDNSTTHPWESEIKNPSMSTTIQKEKLGDSLIIIPNIKNVHHFTFGNHIPLTCCSSYTNERYARWGQCQIGRKRKEKKNKNRGEFFLVFLLFLFFLGVVVGVFSFLGGSTIGCGIHRLSFRWFLCLVTFLTCTTME